MKKTTLNYLLCSLFMIIFAVSVKADMVSPFYPIGQFNTVVFGDMTYTNGTDNMGYMAVGGDINGKSGGLGIATSVSGRQGDVSLVVGGSVNASSGQIYTGDYYVGGSIANIPKFNPGNGTRLDTCPVDFTAMQNELRSTSMALVDMGTEATPLANTWNTQFDVITGELNILNVNFSDLNNGSLSGLQVNGMDTNTQVIINIIGDLEYNVLNMQYAESMNSGSWGNNLMLNLVGIDIFNMNSHGQNNFSILGVDTDINAMYGNFEGLVVANNITLTNAEFHNGRPFEPEIDLPPPSTATPEPGTALILLLGGMVGIPVYRRFHKTSPHHEPRC